MTEQKRTIWVVEGSTGEYSDHNEWAVDAWTTKEAAEARVLFLSEKYRELVASQTRYTAQHDEGCKQMEKFDSKFYCDYTGTYYTCYEVELKEAE